MFNWAGVSKEISACIKLKRTEHLHLIFQAAGTSSSHIHLIQTAHHHHCPRVTKLTFLGGHVRHQHVTAPQETCLPIAPSGEHLLREEHEARTGSSSAQKYVDPHCFQKVQPKDIRNFTNRKRQTKPHQKKGHKTSEHCVHLGSSHPRASCRSTSHCGEAAGRFHLKCHWRCVKKTQATSVNGTLISKMWETGHVILSLSPLCPRVALEMHSLVGTSPAAHQHAFFC